MKRAFMLATVVLATIVTSAQWLPVPAYHMAPPKKGEKLRPLLAGLDLSGPSFKYPFQVHAYQLAARIPTVIYQQPCYCHCDRSVGHTSLHSCFESQHGAHCSTCMKEVFYAYQMHKKGRTASQIREGIVRGDFEQVDLQTATAIN